MSIGFTFMVTGDCLSNLTYVSCNEKFCRWYPPIPKCGPSEGDDFCTDFEEEILPLVSIVHLTYF